MAYDGQEVIGVMQEIDERVVTAHEVAERHEMSRRTALRHLHDLHEQGEVCKKDLSRRPSMKERPVWWLSQTTLDDNAIYSEASV